MKNTNSFQLLTSKSLSSKKLKVALILSFMPFLIVFGAVSSLFTNKNLSASTTSPSIVVPKAQPVTPSAPTTPASESTTSPSIVAPKAQPVITSAPTTPASENIEITSTPQPEVYFNSPEPEPNYTYTGNTTKPAPIIYYSQGPEIYFNSPEPESNYIYTTNTPEPAPIIYSAPEPEVKYSRRSSGSSRGSGLCQYPDDLDIRGNRCGKRAASER